MALFSKKYCDVCDKKIGLLGNRKLEDGNLCKDCAKKLSPFFSERRRSTVVEILEQLEYREQNWDAVSKFNVTRTLGAGTKLLIDEEAGKFIVTHVRRWQDENPDVIDLAQVTGCRVDIDEQQRELTYKDKNNNEVRYDPPRRVYSYDFYIVIHVNSPWFDEIRYRLNPITFEYEPPAERIFMRGARDVGRRCVKYQEYETLAAEICEALQKR